MDSHNSGLLLGVIAFSLAALLYLLIVYSVRERKRPRAALAHRFGEKPQRAQYADLESACLYWCTLIERVPARRYLDAHTWDDLEMDEIFHRINVCQSSVGEEYLYARLRCAGVDEKERERMADMIHYLDKHPEGLDTLRAHPARLGKKDFSGVCELPYLEQEIAIGSP